MTLNEFEKETKASIEDFFKNWREHHKDDPDNWPMEMDHGDWVDQFLAGLFDIAI